MRKGNYTKEDKDFMYLTNCSRNASRLVELISFVKLMNYQKIGIASCFSVKDMAEKLKQILEKENLSVFLVNCKESKLEASELSENMSGLSCDPKAQAEYLNEQETDFNINFGLCLGHGMLFQKYSKAPTTTLLVKDACHKHNITENFL